jgi:hypothetical protein
MSKKAREVCETIATVSLVVIISFGLGLALWYFCKIPEAFLR